MRHIHILLRAQSKAQNSPLANAPTLKDKEIKMATFYNRATLSYDGGVVNSNTTEAELVSGLTLTKTAVSQDYTEDSSVVYAITLSNMSATAYTSLSINDNLGAYTLIGGGEVIPLNYVTGSMLYYLNGVLQPSPTVISVGGLEISNINLPANSTATFIYEAQTNEYAPLLAGSSITNTTSTNGGVGIGILTDTATVTVREGAELTIAKAVCPPVITDNSELTYTIIVQNLGNTAIVATDGVIISDVFNPILTGLTVMLDGVALLEGVGYSYNATTGEFSTLDGTVTVPAATYTQDPTTGVITTTPGVTTLTIMGTV